MFNNDFLKDSEFWVGGGLSERDQQIDNLVKALIANEGGTDVAQYQGFPALGLQSLETMLVLLNQKEKNLVMWQDVPKGNTNQTLHQYAIQLGYGQGTDGWSGQLETQLEADPNFKRKVGNMKYQRQVWKFGDVAGMVGAITSAEKVEKTGAMMRALRSINASLYSGNEAMLPEEITGFETIIRNNGSRYHVVDHRGGNVSQDSFDAAGQLINDNYGSAEGARVYCSSSGLASINSVFRRASTLGAGNDLAQRLNQGNAEGYNLGSRVKGITTLYGDMILRPDINIAAQYEGRRVPMIADPNDPEAIIEGRTSNRSPLQPTLTSITPVAATVSGSKWGNGTVRPPGAGYRFRVVARNRFGRSLGSAEVVAGAVVANGALDIVITPQGGDPFPAACYEVFSSQGVTTTEELYYIGSVAANGANPVTFRDLNVKIPGTTAIFVIDWTQAGEDRVASFIRLAPAHAREYARIGEFRWGSLNVYGELFVYAPRKCVLLDNVSVSVQSINPYLAA